MSISLIPFFFLPFLVDEVDYSPGGFLNYYEAWVTMEGFCGGGKGLQAMEMENIHLVVVLFEAILIL